MKVSFAHLFLFVTLTLALTLPSLFARSSSLALADREPELSDADLEYVRSLPNDEQEPAYHELTRRRGGGGGGGSRGGSSGGSSSGGTSSGGSSSGGSGSSGAGSSGGTRPGSSSSGTSGSSSGGTSGSRGTTSSSTGVAPSLGGGRFFPGGASTSYRSGGISPSGIRPGLLPGAALGFGLGAVFFYPYHSTYPYYVNPTTHRNESLPIDCVCDQNQPCGCDDTNNSTAVQEMLKNSSIAKVENVNGTQRVVINGTLPNGTTNTSGAMSGLATNWLGSWWAVVAIGSTMVWAL